MEAMDEDLGDSDEDMPPGLMDSEDDDCDIYMPPITPRVALGDVFEQLAVGTTRLGSCPRQGFGWSEADVGGHGLCLADYFTHVSAGSQHSELPSTSRAKIKLGDIEWAGVQNLHPSKIFLPRHRIHYREVATFRLFAAAPERTRNNPGVTSWPSLPKIL